MLFDKSISKSWTLLDNNTILLRNTRYYKIRIQQPIHISMLRKNKQIERHFIIVKEIEEG